VICAVPRECGVARLRFAEVAFENGDVQVVDFEEHTRPPGLYRVLDFRDGRQVKTVRLLAIHLGPDHVPDVPEPLSIPPRRRCALM
jgi:hypothetical protein